jgi:DNA polymerase III subunit epsilon
MFSFSNTYKKIAKNLDLDKPLIIFDIEATGLSLSADKIITLAYIKIWNNGRVKKAELFFNPEIRITPEATAVHGIRDEDTKDAPTFKDRAQEIWDLFHDCYYAGYNIMEFDLPMLRREFVRVGMDFEYKEENIIDSKVIYRYLSPRTLSSAYRHYCGKELKPINRAIFDTETAAEILLRQLERYNEVRNWDFIRRVHQPTENKEEEISRKFYWVGGETYLAFSKYKDRKLAEIVRSDPEFLNWILEADFSEDTKNIIRNALKKE